MRTVGALVIAVLLLFGTSGCSGGNDAATSSDQPKLAAAQQTPAFRNLGKRGDSKL